MNLERFSIGELASAAATTPRTIRFYSAEGLLPPPLMEGRNAVYSEAHRRRLRLIQRLKAAYLPLSAIKSHLAGLTDDQVGALLEGGGAHRLETSGVPRGLRTSAAAAEPAAVAYVARILAAAEDASAADGAEAEPKPARPSAPDSGAKPKPARTSAADAATANNADSDAGTGVLVEAPATTAERWERVELRPGLELHIREPLSRTHRARLADLVRIARTLLSE
jgi:DNA-binding transcriptional MerR regulator